MGIILASQTSTLNETDAVRMRSSVSKDELIRATINIDIPQTLRKFTNKNIMLVAKALHSKGPLNFSELQKETDLSTNLQNHALHEMKKTNLVIQVDRQYYLTRYCVLLLEAINRLRIEVKNTTIKDDGLFAPVTASSRG
jgi:DNA-binding HxlR family transcriptional regulator